MIHSRPVRLLLLFLFLFFLPHTTSTCPGSKSTFSSRSLSSTPTPTTVIGTNPARGLTEYGGAPYDTEVLYVRYYWEDLEPTKGNFDWTQVENSFWTARQRGETVGFRLMPFGDPFEEAGLHPMPSWLRAEVGDSNGEIGPDGNLYPDHNNEAYLSNLERFLTAWGAQFANDPRLSFVDIGGVGYWGEWHMYSLLDPEPLYPSQTNSERIIDAHIAAFPNVPLVMLIGCEDSVLTYAWNKPLFPGIGIRADCLGDWSTGGWNHMVNAYPPKMTLFGTRWSTDSAPVLFESCSDFEWQRNQGYPMSTTYQQTLDWHASNINDKDTITTNLENADWFNLLRKMGYRFVPLSGRVFVKDDSSGAIDVCVSWENAGVAAPFNDLQLEYRVRLSSGGGDIVLDSSEDIRRWLPTDANGRDVDESYTSGQVGRSGFTATDVVEVLVCMYYPVESSGRLPVKMPIAASIEPATACYPLSLGPVESSGGLDCPGSPDCSNHGTCLDGSPDYCDCDAGWTGNDCSGMDCPGSPDCNSRGTCTAGSPPYCACDTGWTGTDCTGMDCIGSPDCNNHGTCTAGSPPYCVCDSGWTGSGCTGMDCPGSPDCNSHGTCTSGSPPYCSCDSGWGGADCSTIGCPGTPECNDHGTCTAGSPPYCACDSGYSGSACTVMDCPGTPDCNNHGSCSATSPPSCSCNSDWTGTTCENPLCSPTCSTHGTCTGGSPNFCACEDGYGSGDCSVFICGGILAGLSGVCSDHGSCDGPNTCTCDSGWHGDVCSHEVVDGAVCDGIPSSDPSTCGGVGTCRLTGCECDFGFIGQFCEIEVLCYGVSALDPTVCSGKGDCLNTDYCVCHEDIAKGDNCEKPPSSGGLTSTQSIFLGVGVASVVVIGVVLLVLCVIVVCCCAAKKKRGFRRERLESTEPHFNDFEDSKSKPRKPRKRSFLQKRARAAEKNDVELLNAQDMTSPPHPSPPPSRAFVPPRRDFGRAAAAPAPPRRSPHVPFRSFNSPPSPASRPQHTPSRSMAPVPARRQFGRGRGVGRAPPPPSRPPASLPSRGRAWPRGRTQGRNVGRVAPPPPPSRPARGRGAWARGRGRGRGRGGRGRGRGRNAGRPPPPPRRLRGKQWD